MRLRRDSLERTQVRDYSLNVMSGETQTVRMNFGTPKPIFPLHGIVLLPHAVVPLHIFEERYRQMMEHVLDGAGQVALAVFEDDVDLLGAETDAPTIKPVVCVGQIVQHERLADGRYNMLLQGVCRARIAQEIEPDEDHLYRRAMLRPLARPENEDAMLGVRERLKDLLSDVGLTQLAAAEGLVRCLEQEEAPTSAILELVGISVVTDNDLKYRLLEEPSAIRRAAIIEEELIVLRELVSRAAQQIDPEAPKGCNWN